MVTVTLRPPLSSSVCSRFVSGDVTGVESAFLIAHARRRGHCALTRRPVWARYLGAIRVTSRSGPRLPLRGVMIAAWARGSRWAESALYPASFSRECPLQWPSFWRRTA